ncbi:MAG: hypothetical protein H0X66_02310 [Verrucomicrobia bacterium]|nr:hypothetical protein [Verrucomicrobiota bacterium]
MTRALALILMLFLTACSDVGDTRLDGTWASDREATVAYGRSLSPDMDWGKYSQIFGHLRVTYDANTMTTDFQGHVERRPLRLVRRDKDSVTAKVWDDLDEKERLVTIHFVDADTYWIYIRDTDHREYFKRLKEAKPSDAPNDGPAMSVEESDGSGGGRHR